MAEVTNRPVLAALAVVLEGDRVLLVRRRNPPDAGLWGFPGGKVHFGETVADAATRELAEETGVMAEARGFLTLIEVIGESESGPHHFALAPVLCRYVSGSPAAADDVSDAAWVPVAEVLQGGLPTSRRVPEVARLALDRHAC